MNELFNRNLPVVTEYDDRFDKSTIDEVMAAASAGDPAALYELAARYRLGVDGAPEDQARSVALYKEVLKYQTNINALYHIGYLLADGACGDEGIAEGLEYFKTAYSLGDGDSALQLGIQYEFGDNVPQDLNKARDYYTFAISHGRGDAIFNLGEIYLRENNLEEARKCYEQALAFDTWKEDAEQRLASLGEITADVALPGQYIQEAKQRLDSGNYPEAFKIITEAYNHYPNDLNILYELVNIDDIVLHAAYFSGNFSDSYENLCHMLLHHIGTLRAQSHGDPNFLDKAESDVSYFLSDIYMQKEDMDAARDILTKVNVDHTPMGAYSIFMTHVYDIDRYQYELCNDVQLFERAVRSGNWPTPAMKALAYLGLSAIYASGAPNVPQDLAYGYECAKKSNELDQKVGGPELAKYSKNMFGKITYRG